MKRSPWIRVLRRWVGALCIAAGATLLVGLAVAWPRATLRSPEPSLLLQDRHGSYLGDQGAQLDAVVAMRRAGDPDLPPLLRSAEPEILGARAAGALMGRRIQQQQQQQQQ